MYAMVASVRIEADRSDEAQRTLDEFTIPMVKSQEGFVRGVWLRASDGTRGRGVVIFDNEEHAKATAEVARQGPPPDSPVTLENIEIFEVVGEA